jgi:hypothetical protein
MQQIEHSAVTVPWNWVLRWVVQRALADPVHLHPSLVRKK